MGKGKMLMIHGWAQNAKVLKYKSKTLTRKLNQSGYDCIFIDGPFNLPMKSTIEINGEKVEVDNGKRENAKAWFLYSNTDPADASSALTETPMSYVGLEDACKLICDILEKEVEENEFCGILGFSQGAVMVHILSAITSYNNSNEAHNQEKNINDIASTIEKEVLVKERTESISKPFHKIKCSVFISGFKAMHNGPIEPYLPSMSLSNTTTNLSNIPSLHIIGNNDTSVIPELSKKLYSYFYHSSNNNDSSSNSNNILYHEKGHIIPQRSNDCAIIIQFLDKNSKK